MELAAIRDRFRDVHFQGRLATLPRDLHHVQQADRADTASTDRVDSLDIAQEEDVAFLGDLFERAGLNLRRYRLSPMRRRMKACCRALRAPSVAEALAMLRRDPQAASRAIDAVMLGVSEFFRDRSVFDDLRFNVLPGLAAANRPLRIASIGCSDGRELYSVAMLLAEMGALDGASLHGVDCRAEAIASARAACFSVSALGDLPDRLRERYFTIDRSGYRVTAELRRRTTWTTANVFNMPAMAACDLVLFRNVTIYLEPGWAVQAWRRVLPLVRPGGIVVAGKAERPPDTAGLIRLAPCIYRSAL